MHSNGAETRIFHREMIGRIYYTQAANTDQSFLYFVNPGDGNTFPWLHTVASNYQEYKMLGCAFYYKSLVNQLFSSATMASGQVILATDYNAARPSYAAVPFASATEAENTQYTTIAKLQSNLYHPLECDPSLNPVSAQWVRTTQTLPANTDPRLYDMCKTQLIVNCPITGTVAAPVLVGELWATYDVLLRKPIFIPNADAESDFFDLQCSANNVYPVTASGSFAGNSLGCTITFDANPPPNARATIRFPSRLDVGIYCLTFMFHSAAAALVYGMTPFTYTNCQQITVQTGGPSGSATTQGGTDFTYVIFVQVTAANASMLFGLWNTAGSYGVPNVNVNGLLTITAVDADITFPQNVLPNI